MFRLFRKRSSPAINEVKPAPEERVIDTVDEPPVSGNGHFVDEKARRRLSELFPSSHGDKLINSDEASAAAREIDDGLIRRTEQWSLSGDSQPTDSAAAASIGSKGRKRPSDMQKSRTPALSVAPCIVSVGDLESSSDDEVKAIFLRDKSLSPPSWTGAACWLANSPLQAGRKTKKALRLSRHVMSVSSPRKKRKGSVRPFLNFEKMRQSKQTVGLRKVQAIRVKFARPGSPHQLKVMECDSADPSALSFCAIPSTTATTTLAPSMDTSVVVPPHCVY
eukprot:m.55374 g.55374  ORF g.55374 m.55374 type:complete len:278 (+) comp34465_c0_seq1:209-1042(+)